MTTPPVVTVERDGHVLLIGVDRAAKRNAWDLQVIDEVGAADDVLAVDVELRVGVVFGHGDHFSAGLDLAQVLPAVQEHGPSVLGGSRRTTRSACGARRCPSPSSWPCRASPSRWRSSSRSRATSSSPPMTCGSVSSRSGAASCPSAVRRCARLRSWAGGNAMRFLLTAEEFGAEEALRIGLVQEVVAAGEQRERALAIARTVATQAPLGVQASLANSRLAMRGDRERAAAEHLQAVLPALVASEDAAEGVTSFLERREARFSGR